MPNAQRIEKTVPALRHEAGEEFGTEPSMVYVTEIPGSDEIEICVAEEVTVTVDPQALLHGLYALLRERDPARTQMTMIQMPHTVAA